MLLVKKLQFFTGSQVQNLVEVGGAWFHNAVIPGKN